MLEHFALVAGSSSGLGLEISKYLLAEGYTVFGGSRSGTDIEKSNFVDIVLDVTDEYTVEQMFHAIEMRTDHLDLIINSAGFFEASPLEEVSTKEFSKHLNTYVLGAFHLLKHSRKFAIENRTHFIHILSKAAKKGVSNFSAYSAAQHGLHGLLESCQNEWANSGFRFTNLYPEAIDTPMWKELETEGLISTDFMVDINDFMQLFDFVVKCPEAIQLSEIVFSKRRDTRGEY